MSNELLLKKEISSEFAIPSPELTPYLYLQAFLHQKPFYRRRLLVLLGYYWMMAGIMEGILQTPTPSPTLPVIKKGIMAASLIMVVVVVGIFGRYMTIIITQVLLYAITQVLLIVLCLFLAIFLHQEIQVFQSITTGVMSCLHLAVPILFILIALESFQPDWYPLIISIAVGFFLGGRLLYIQLISSHLPQIDSVLWIMLPMAIVGLVLCGAYEESVRYLMESDIGKAEGMVKRIARINKIESAKLVAFFNKDLFWKKIELKRYSFLALWRYGSLSTQSYCSLVCFVCLGILAPLPREYLGIGIGGRRSEMSVELWISVWQTLAVIPTYAAMFGLGAGRKGIIASSAIIAVLIGFLFCINNLNISSRSVLNVYSFVIPFYIYPQVWEMALFCLCSFFSVLLGAFLLLHSLYVYPLTIRYIGIPLSFACFLIGNLLFRLHFDFIGSASKDASMQIAQSAALLIIAHSIMLSSHAVKEEITQIQELYSQDF